MEGLIAVATGLLAGTITGIVPGAGVTVAMVLATPLLMSFDVTQLLLFYMSLASMVQFTGTIPAVYLGVPGETNSLPAVIEGTKFNRRKMAKLAIGICAVGSVLGSLVAVAVTYGLLSVLVEHMTVFFSNATKFYLYIFIIAFCLLVYNKKNILVNLLLCAAGFMLSVPGESDISPDFRYTFGIEDLQFGVPLMPVLIGFLIVPTIAKMFSSSNSDVFLPNIDIGFCKVITYFRKKLIASSLRGSIIGYLCGFVPGVSTVLSTNASYSFEKKLHPNNPGKLLVSSETANNSGQFASMLPLLLIGIPITGSEIVLYSLLVDAGWSPFQFDNVNTNADMIFRQIVPWFVVANIAGLVIAWPLARHILKLFANSKKFLIAVLVVGVLLLNTYLGVLDYRVWLYTVCLLVFSGVGLLLKKYETVPLIFMYILGNDIEAVFYRQMLI
ncbi:MAG: tripartite tricarboxylate transporter permease [Rhodospirillales bacterium]